MSITIENPTAEAIFQALQKVPTEEIERLKVLLNAQPQENLEAEEEAWRAASAQSATRFFEEEEE